MAALFAPTMHHFAASPEPFTLVIEQILSNDGAFLPEAEAFCFMHEAFCSGSRDIYHTSRAQGFGDVA